VLNRRALGRGPPTQGNFMTDTAGSTSDRLGAEIAIIGSGPGGAVTATLLAEAGYDVLMIEEGAHLGLESAPHFSRDEITQKYRGGGIGVAMGKAKVTYVEGRVVGGGSEINRGLYHRIPETVLDDWRRGYKVDALHLADLQPGFDACEATAKVSYLPGPAARLSLKLHEGAQSLGWQSVEVPRLFTYAANPEPGAFGKKQSMSETFVPRFLAAGGRLQADCRITRLRREAGGWRLEGRQQGADGRERSLEIRAGRVFVACGAVQTPALLRRSGIRRNVGDNLRFHTMIKMVARFDEVVNVPGQFDPVHQIKEFDPRFSMGCSMSSRAVLALTLADRPERIAEIDRDWQRMGIYYAQITGGQASVRTLPGFADPLVRVRYAPADLRELALGLHRLAECLLAAGATTLDPGIGGAPALHNAADLATLPEVLPSDRSGLSALHLFSSCPMGEDEHRCAADSFGRVHGVDGLHIADSSLLCGPTVVNPQGTVMALAWRNAMHFIEQDHRGGRIAAPAPGPERVLAEP
jgi:choline dehydrogenase-like flavoprotein